MHKIWVIAAREYRAAVRSKAFLISLVMMPLLMGASIGIQFVMHKLDDTKEKTYAVIDRTPGHKIFDYLETAVEQRNEYLIFDPETHKQNKPKFKLERIEPSLGDKEAIDKQRFELSQRAEKGEIEGFLEIGPEVYRYEANAPADPLRKPKDEASVRYQSNKPTNAEFSRWAEAVINRGVQQQRFEDANIPERKIQAIQQPVAMRVKGLSHRDPKTGEIADATDESQIANIAVPGVLITLIFILIFVGATPAMQGVVEEKMQRIAEVLLGSVKPFELMAGKLLGMIGVSLTVAAFYLSGIFYLVHRYNLTEYLSVTVLAWFLVYLILAILMYGSLFLAIGAAVTEVKETQALVMPVMMIAVMPLLLLGPIMLDPNSTFSTMISLFPPSAPMLMTARIAVPPGIPWWQPVVGIIGVVATTLVCVYAAGRIFRVGILMQGKGARYSDLVKWVVRG
ncbi:MAG: ABC transporter permease [Gemmataceae bacterium]